MNIIIDKTSSLVLLQSESPITTIDGVFAIDGVKVGISTQKAMVVVASPMTPFYPEVYAYINGNYEIANDSRLTACIAQDKSLHNAKQKENRAKAYTAEADPLFFKAQRGEATTADWEAKVAEIKTRYPYQS